MINNVNVIDSSSWKISKTLHKIFKGYNKASCKLQFIYDGRQTVGEYVTHYNNVRLHSSIGYIALKIKFKGGEKQLFDERDRKLKVAREKRKTMRAAKSVTL